MILPFDFSIEAHLIFFTLTICLPKLLAARCARRATRGNQYSALSGKGRIVKRFHVGHFQSEPVS